MEFDLPRHSGKAVFLISKPLQLMIALCIVNQGKWDTRPVFIILDAFSGASEVAERLLHDFNQFQAPVFFTSREAALAFIKEKKFAHLFIDSDVGVKNFLTLASQKLSNPNLLIYVYEEGLGTYRTDLYHGFKKNLLRLFGVGVFFGACRFVNKVYVFKAKEYINNFPSNSLKVNTIRGSITELLTENCDALKRIFGFDGITKTSKKALFCAVYLSNWKIDEEFISHLRHLEGDIFIKPHPKIRNRKNFEGIITIKPNIPAELIIIDLMSTYRTVRIFDHQSSVRRYISGKNLTFTLAQSELIK